MKFETVSLFDKQFKKLAKKYNLIKEDVKNLIENFEDLHQQTTAIKTKAKVLGIEFIII